MKKKVILIFLCGLVTIQTMAQRKPESQTYETKTEVPLYGKLNYNYIIDKDGDKLFDGPVSISAKLTQNGLQRNVFSPKINFRATYNLKSNCKQGYLNGPISLIYNMSATAKGKTDVRNSSYKGVFLNGEPNGYFDIKVKKEMSYTLRATYKKSFAVGAFYYNGYTSGDISWPCTIKGSLTQDGTPTGAWVYTVNNETKHFTFKNGVMIASDEKDRAYSPKLKSLALKFANKQITEEQLNKQNIFVSIDSTQLVGEAEEALFDPSIIRFKDIAQIYSIHSYNKPFKILRELPILSAEGEKLICNRVFQVKGAEIGSAIYDAQDLFGCLHFDEDSKMYYIKPYVPQDWYEYTTDPSNKKSDLYVRNEFVDSLKTAYDTEKVKNAKDLIDIYIKRYHTHKSIALADNKADIGTVRKTIEMINNKDTTELRQTINSKDPYMYGLTYSREITVTPYMMAKKYQELRVRQQNRIINDIESDISSMENYLDNLKGDIYETETNPDYFVIYGYKGQYIRKSSIETMKNFIADCKNLIPEIQKKFAEENAKIEADLKVMEDAQKIEQEKKDKKEKRRKKREKLFDSIFG